MGHGTIDRLIDQIDQLSATLKQQGNELALTSEAFSLLDEWVTILGQFNGEPVEWPVIDPLWRRTHDLLSEAKSS